MKIFLTTFFAWVLGVGWAQAQGDATLLDRLQSNIFLKVEASGTDVFVGEPITVTYKLYSALESESSIVHKPSFVGFDIKDLATTRTQMVTRENIDGVVFDVHTVLKVELTPYKAGRLSLGSLTMRNRVRLVDINGNKDRILNGMNEEISLTNGYYTFQISSIPITVLATATPQVSRPSVYNGVIGLFKMEVTASKSLYAPDEKGALTISIMGVGNFSKIAQPEIKWPEGIKTFPAQIDEETSRKKDGDGYKSFTIPFSVSKPGKYVIPSVNFTFFDITTNKYKTITNIPVEFDVVAEGAAQGSATPVTTHQSNELKKDDLMDVLRLGIGILVLLLVLLVLWTTLRRKKRKMPSLQKADDAPKQGMQPKNLKVSIEHLLQPAADALYSTGNTFSNCTKQAIVSFFESRYMLSAGSFNQESAKQVFAKHQIAAGIQVELLALLSELDIDIYSGGSYIANKEELLNKTRSVLNQLS